MDWSQCPEVERIPGKVSGAWLVRGTRVPADAVLANAADGYSAEEIAEQIFEGVPADQVRRLLEFAKQHHALAS
jgi:uncharacterized protein (DUF433 family)